MRKIIHIDMDAFYASVEQRDNPALRGRPIAVGHASGRGVVAAASYEARRFGVRSAISCHAASRLCPNLIFVEPDFDKYKAVSAEMHRIFHEYTDLVEPISLDEAFLDITVNKPEIPLAVDIAIEIKQKIRSRLGLVASAGVSYNKFLAKIASDYRKPDGLCTIHPSVAKEFIASIPVKDFWGVGPVTARKMEQLGIKTGADLREWSAVDLTREFGKAGLIYYNFARGIDTRPVESFRQRKSLGCERTFEKDILLRKDIDQAISSLSAELFERMERKGFFGNSLTLKVKFADFTVTGKSFTAQDDFQFAEEIERAALRSADLIELDGRAVRLLGLSLSNTRLDKGSREETFVPGEWRQLLIDFDFQDSIL